MPSSLIYKDNQTQMENQNILSIETNHQYPIPLKHEKPKIISISVVGLILIIIGIIIGSENKEIAKEKFLYAEECIIPKGEFNTTCSFTGVISEDMQEPIFLYYRLTKVYQNHRSFVLSIELDQFLGECDGTPETGCSSSRDVCEVHDCFLDDIAVPSNKKVMPEGLQPWSIFNDEIAVSITRSDVEESTICEDGSVESAHYCTDKSDIALQVDRDVRFGKVSNFDPEKTTRGYSSWDDYRGPGEIPEITDQSLMVWMRYAATPDFTKLHGVIHHSLKKGDIIQFQINNRFNTNVFHGSKSFILSTTGKYGGLQHTLSLSFIFTGILSFTILAIIFIIHWYLSKKHQEIVAN